MAMASPEIASPELLQRLQKELDNEELTHIFASCINDSTYRNLVEYAYYAVMKKRPSWPERIGHQKCCSQDVRQPTSCSDLVNAVKEGKGISKGLHVRAVGPATLSRTFVPLTASSWTRMA